MFAGSLPASLLFNENRLWMGEILSYPLISNPSLAHLNDAIVSSLDANPPLFANRYWIMGQAVSLNVVWLKVLSVICFGLTLATPIRTYVRAVCTDRLRIFYHSARANAPVSERPAAGWAHDRIAGLGLALTHYFGLFYLAASGAFFGLLWPEDRR